MIQITLILSQSRYHIFLLIFEQISDAAKTPYKAEQVWYIHSKYN